MLTMAIKLREHGLDPLLEEAIAELSSTLSVDGYMQHFTKVYTLRKKCGMKLPKLPEGQSEPMMSSESASMSLMVPQEGLYLRLKAMERQFKREKEDRENGFARDSENAEDSNVFAGYTKAEEAAMSSKRCLAHFTEEKRASFEAAAPPSVKRRPGRPRKSAVPEIWWGAALFGDPSDAPARVSFSSAGEAHAHTAAALGITADEEPAANPEEPTSSSHSNVPTVPPSPSVDVRPHTASTHASSAPQPKKLGHKKSFPVIDWFSDLRKGNSPTMKSTSEGQNPTPVKKSRLASPQPAPQTLEQLLSSRRAPAIKKAGSRFGIFKKRGRANAAEKSSAQSEVAENADASKKYIPIHSM